MQRGGTRPQHTGASNGTLGVGTDSLSTERVHRGGGSSAERRASAVGQKGQGGTLRAAA